MFSSGSHVLYLFREQTVSSENTLACQTVADIDRHWLLLAQTQSLTNKSSHVQQHAETLALPVDALVINHEQLLRTAVGWAAASTQL